ncbi:uncharacterized protein LOC62_06G007852 [Vanrija pseudolonga]|uniref:Uncharacterized protein n=1 Tax=Vanrija pseudolonga TaxID=143232 RepID=A0AAF0YEA3_9TREE|nr:hypothetical protein LOC62_06G007852 [Vanrija pseudolonga]
MLLIPALALLLHVVMYCICDEITPYFYHTLQRYLRLDDSEMFTAVISFGLGVVFGVALVIMFLVVVIGPRVRRFMGGTDVEAAYGGYGHFFDDTRRIRQRPRRVLPGRRRARYVRLALHSTVVTFSDDESPSAVHDSVHSTQPTSVFNDPAATPSSEHLRAFNERRSAHYRIPPPSYRPMSLDSAALEALCV